MPILRVLLVIVLLITTSNNLIYASQERKEGRTPFWLGVQANQQIDIQVAEHLKDSAEIVVFRAYFEGAIPKYNLSEVIARIRDSVESVPILIYAWVSRYFENQRSGSAINSWLDEQPELLIKPLLGRKMTTFGNVIDQNYREKVVANISEAITNLNADGVAIDLAIRNPDKYPKLISQYCLVNKKFCSDYAKGMDASFMKLKETMANKLVIYNGLWNYDKNTIKNQLKLLKYNDATIVEYFGMDPRKSEHSFQNDILPYLDVMKNFPDNKKLFVYGRGKWHYTDFNEDFLWQRYLYCSFLLGARDNTYFKYHSTFQVATIKGRSGGIDKYLDWVIPLGKPKETYQFNNGVYSREFSKGMVFLVRDDEKKPKKIMLEKEQYSPEGKLYYGEITIQPGEALLLLNQKQANKTDIYVADLEKLADWSGANWIQIDKQTKYLAIEPITTPGLQGEHDIFLERNRSLAIYSKLQLKVKSESDNGSLFIVVEVDDPEGRLMKLLIVLESKNDPLLSKKYLLPEFRRPYHDRSPRAAVINGPVLRKDTFQTIELDGPSLLNDSGYKFRGWRYLRVNGKIKLSSIKLYDNTLH